MGAGFRFSTAKFVVNIVLQPFLRTAALVYRSTISKERSGLPFTGSISSRPLAFAFQVRCPSYARSVAPRGTELFLIRNSFEPEKLEMAKKIALGKKRPFL